MSYSLQVSQLQSHQQPSRNENQLQSVAYEFPIDQGGQKRSNFVAGEALKQQSPEDLGEPAPVYLKNGPRPDRGCKDFICLVIFMFFLLYYSMLFFNMVIIDFQFPRFSVPHDPDHRPCGHDKYKGYHYIYFASPEKDHLFRTVCVSKCPTNLPKDLTNYKLDCLPNSLIANCTYNPSKDLDKQFLIYDTNIYLNSVCLPTDRKLFDEISPALSINVIQQEFSNIKKTLSLIIVSAILSFILGGIFFGFLGMCGDFLTWFFIFSFVGFFILLGGVFFERGTNGFIPIVETSTNQEDFKYISKRISGLKEYKVYFILAGIACWVFSLVTIGLVAYFHKKIKVISAQLKLSASFIAQNMYITIVPLVLFIFMISFFIFWVYLCIQIMGSESVISSSSHMPFDQFEITQPQRIKLLINFIFLLVFRGFLVGCSDFLIYSTCCIWYYKKERDDYDPLKLSLKRLFFYHFGSIVLHGTVVTLLDYPIRISNIICDYLAELQKKERNKCPYYFSSAFLCACCLFDKFLRYLNRYALLFISLSGDNYYDSSVQAYYLLKRNARRFHIIRGVGGYFFTMAKLFLALFSSLICYIILISFNYYANKITETFTPSCAFFLLAYTTASFFIDMYQDSSTTLILTSYIDEEVEKVHFGKEDALNSPFMIRGFLASLKNVRR